MTSQRTPFAGVFGTPTGSMPVFGEPTGTMPVFGPTIPPLWTAADTGPAFMRRPIAAGRTSAFGPPFEVRPGPLPRQDKGMGRYLRPYPNHPWAGLGSADAGQQTIGNFAVAGLALFGGLWLLRNLAAKA